MISENKLISIKNKIRNECKNCSGAECKECNKKISRILKYSDAGIPLEYWFLSFKDFSGDQNFKTLILSKIENIDGLYSSGKSLAFVGNFGTGKTYAGTSILKKAILKGYSVMYINMTDLVNKIVSAKDNSYSFMDSLMNVDFLMIDEFDKRGIYPTEKAEQLFGQSMEYVLRNRFQNQMPTILGTNTKEIDNVLSEDFSKAFSSLRAKYVDVVYVSGKDFRKNGAKNNVIT